MVWVYFDASALIKRYSQEIGTPLINEIFRLIPLGRMVCASIGILEIVSILTRKVNDGRLDRALFNQAMIEFKAEVVDHGDFAATPINDALLFSALELIAKHHLNATDTIVLRSALDLRQALQASGDDLVLCASDKRLLRAAQVEGIQSFDPETFTKEQLHQIFGLSGSATSGRS